MEEREITFNGIDPVRDPIRPAVQNIVIFESFKGVDGIGLAGKVRHGDKAKLIDRDGNWCLIEFRKNAKAPKRGWVSFRFIHEFRGEWVTDHMRETAQALLEEATAMEAGGNGADPPIADSEKVTSVPATFTFQCGQKAHLCHLNMRTVASICAPYGTLNDILTISQNDVDRATPEQLQQLGLVKTRFLDYCAGWGFNDDPPRRDRRALEKMGCDMDNQHIVRKDWFHFMLLSSEAEAAAFLSAVITYTFA